VAQSLLKKRGGIGMIKRINIEVYKLIEDTATTST
jgi:hypothetical protein